MDFQAIGFLIISPPPPLKDKKWNTRAEVSLSGHMLTYSFLSIISDCISDCRISIILAK